MKIPLKPSLLLCFIALFSMSRTSGQTADSSLSRLKVFVIGSMDKNHSPMVKKSIPMFQKMADENGFDIHFTRDTAELNTENLSKYQVFIQLSIAYFDFSRAQQFAIQQFITSGRGWIGIHGAGLTGKQFAAKDGVDWKWYWHLLGDAYYTPHPPLQTGTLNIIDRNHPITKNLPASFTLRDEWYEFEQAPSNVHVLAVADESTYKPKKPMGYHPVMWTNPEYDRVLYISVGHDSTSCDSEPYRTLLRDAIKWAAGDGKEPTKQAEHKVSVLVNRSGYSTNLPKAAMVQTATPLKAETAFQVVDAMTLDSVYMGKVKPPAQVSGGSWLSTINFDRISTPGHYYVQLSIDDKVFRSPYLEIARPHQTIPLKATSSGKIKALILTERGGHHESFVVAALAWLKDYGARENLEFTELNNADTITTDLLAQYPLFIQLNYPPYMWSEESKAAFEDYIDNGKGAWIGFHHASLLGEFDGYPMWPWFSDFLGGIRFRNYVAARADGEVHIEKKRHAVFAGLPSHFNLPGEEWYTFDKNPRAKADVLATVDENSYKPATDIRMGDHPVIWLNPKKKAKNIYFLFGHHGGLFEVKEFRQLLSNTMKWAAKSH